MAKKDENEERKTVLIRKSLWKELLNIKVNEEYGSISDVVEDMLATRRKRK